MISCNMKFSYGHSSVSLSLSVLASLHYRIVYIGEKRMGIHGCLDDECFLYFSGDSRQLLCY